MIIFLFICSFTNLIESSIEFPSPSCINLWEEISTGSNSGDLILENLLGGLYYLMVEFDADGCTVFKEFRIEEEQIYSVPNIKGIYV